MARKILGWSDSEFWSATPRKFLAVYFTYLDLQERINNIPTNPKPLFGKEAIKSLESIAGRIR